MHISKLNRSVERILKKEEGQAQNKIYNHGQKKKRPITQSKELFKEKYILTGSGPATPQLVFVDECVL